jgi:hypothetical protein
MTASTRCVTNAANAFSVSCGLRELERPDPEKNDRDGDAHCADTDAIRLRDAGEKQRKELSMGVALQKTCPVKVDALLALVLFCCVGARSISAPRLN